MKKLLLILGMVILPAVAAATAPNFSGTWARDSANSDPVPDLAYWMTRVPPAAPRPASGPQRPVPAVLLTVHQDAMTLNVIDPSSAIHEYTLNGDGSSHVTAMDTGIQKAQVTAQLQADNLVIETVEPYGGMPGNVTLKVKEVWSLSADGKTLTITTTRDAPARHQSYKEIYTRTQDQLGTICSDGCVPRK
jgi:hypothetical protein